MNIIAIGKTERIEYRNVGRIIDQCTCFIVYPIVDEFIEVVVNCHMVAKSENHITIEKCCLVCNEVYIDVDFC